MHPYDIHIKFEYGYGYPYLCFKRIRIRIIRMFRHPDPSLAGSLSVFPVRNKTKASPPALPYLLWTVVAQFARACRTLRVGAGAGALLLIPGHSKPPQPEPSLPFSKRLGSQVASRGEVQDGRGCGYPMQRRSDIFSGKLGSKSAARRTRILLCTDKYDSGRRS